MAVHPSEGPRADETALRGVVAILFGLALLVWPGPTITIIAVAFAAYALISGALALTAARRQSSEHHDWLKTAAEGVVAIAAGLAILFWRALSATVVIYVIAAWAIISAIPAIFSALRARDWLQGAEGVVLAVLGIILLASPGSTLRSLATVIGGFALVWGVVGLARGFAGPRTSARA
jgi:uncharacterized membrane protein HdeD (DUF308 family)